MVEYRPIDINVDKPQEGDELFAKDSNEWVTRMIHTFPFNKDYIYRRPIVGITQDSSFKKEEVMSTNSTTPETVSFEAVKSVAKATVRLAGRLAWRGLNYWAFEPVKEVATKVMRAVRYVTLTGVVVGGIYAYNNPEAAKETFWKCLPKIELNVEAPEIMNS